MYSFLEVLFLMFHLVFMIMCLKYVLCKFSVGSKVLCMLIKLVCSGISLKTTQDCLYCTWKAVRWPFMWYNSLSALFNHWMYYIHKLRKKDACSLNTSTLLQWSVADLDITAGSIHPKILVLTMWPKNLLGHGAGACMPPPATGGQPGLRSGCRLPRRWAPRCGGMLSPAPIALLQLTRNFQANIPAEAYGRIYVVC